MPHSFQYLFSSFCLFLFSFSFKIKNIKIKKRIALRSYLARAVWTNTILCIHGSKFNSPNNVYFSYLAMGFVLGEKKKTQNILFYWLYTKALLTPDYPSKSILILGSSLVNSYFPGQYIFIWTCMLDKDFLNGAYIRDLLDADLSSWLSFSNKGLN